MNHLRDVLMERDRMTEEEANAAIAEARREVRAGADPDDVLQDSFGLEPDYVFDII
jgi:hypothetical protein